MRTFRLLFSTLALGVVLVSSGRAANDTKKVYDLPAGEAASALKLTGKDLLAMNLIDEIIKEPLGGAHYNPQEAANYVRSVLKRHWKEIRNLDVKSLLCRRYEKYRRMGVFESLTHLPQADKLHAKRERNKREKRVSNRK